MDQSPAWHIPALSAPGPDCTQSELKLAQVHAGEFRGEKVGACVDLTPREGYRS
jgi:hypothetical protein